MIGVEDESMSGASSDSVEEARVPDKPVRTLVRGVVIALAAVVVAYGTWVVISRWHAIFAGATDMRTLAAWWDERRYIVFFVLYGACLYTLVRPRRAVHLLRCSALWALASLFPLLPIAFDTVSGITESEGPFSFGGVFRLFALAYAAVLVALLAGSHMLAVSTPSASTCNTPSGTRNGRGWPFALALLGAATIVIGVGAGVLGHTTLRDALFVAAGLSLAVVHLGLREHFLVGAAIAIPGILANSDPAGGSVLYAALCWGPGVVVALLALLDRRCPLRLRLIGIVLVSALLVVSSIAPGRVMSRVKFVTASSEVLDELNRADGQ
jgi:hypothetical protein